MISHNMAEIIKKLEHGDVVETADLQWFVRVSELTIERFSGVPAYTLFIRDLSMKHDTAKSYLFNRRNERRVGW